MMAMAAIVNLADKYDNQIIEPFVISCTMGFIVYWLEDKYSLHIRFCPIVGII